MFQEGIHRARVKHKMYRPWIDCMVEYISDCRIYLYTNLTSFAGTCSDNFYMNSYGYLYCFHSSKNWIEDVIYLDHNFIGEL